MSEAQIFAVTLTLLPIMAFAAVYVVLLCRHGKVDDGETQIVLMKGGLQRLRRELADVRKERDALKQAIRSLAADCSKPC